MERTYRIGIDLGGTRIKAGLIKNGQVLSSQIFDVGSNKKLKSVLPELEKQILQLSGMQSDRIQGIGVAFPGVVDGNNHKVIDTSAKYSDAPVVDLVGWAKDTFGLSLKMDNDARLACLGEWHYGSGRGAVNMVMLTLGTGIGTAAVIDGKLLRGKHFQAGILGGHFMIDYKNRTLPCSCGKYGCAEAAASTWGIEGMAKRHSLFQKSALSTADRFDWQVILKLADQGDELSRIIKFNCLDAWVAVMVNLMHAYDPEIIVIGGGISQSGDFMVSYFEKALRERCWSPGGIPELRTAAFPDTAALLGAATLFDK